ncbi:MAG TPA: AgmX/PglI C-terminal domain-containing protein [Enhygromyxa sp.]|nr:AgmX/PglI C-terminal domain-containing protein [Enhygromyxa sp.]
MLLLSIALLVAGAGAGFFVLMAGSDQSKPVKIVQVAPAVEAIPPVPAPPPIVDDPATPEPSQPPATSPTKPSKADRLARDLQREQIWSALGREHNLKPAAPGSAAPSQSAAELLPTLDPSYVREAVREQLVPVAVDCYNTVLTKQDEKAGGKLVLEFTIIGVEEVGGVVEEAEIAEESTLDNEFLRECLRESLMAVTFDPPPDGGRVTVTYPLTFEPE